MEPKKRCPVGCVCGKHRNSGRYAHRPCSPGCQCRRHAQDGKRQQGKNSRTGQKAKGWFLKEFSTGKKYKILTGQQGHPLASPNHQVSEHRKVLFDKIGPGPHACHWGCGKVLDWHMSRRTDAIKADHINGDTLDNSSENLVASCAICNARRGLAGNPPEWLADYV